MRAQASPVRFLLVRHAQMAVGERDGGLSEVGRRQAAALVAAIDWAKVDEVIASPLRRAVETADAFGRPFVQDERLVEFDFGPEWPSGPEAVAERMDLVLWRAAHGNAGGETLGSFQARVSMALDDLAMCYEGRSVVLVAHAGTIDAALRWSYCLPPDADWMTEIVCPNAAITEILHWPRGRFPEAEERRRGAPRSWLVRRVGDSAHLAAGLLTDI